MTWLTEAMNWACSYSHWRHWCSTARVCHKRSVLLTWLFHQSYCVFHILWLSNQILHVYIEAYDHAFAYRSGDSYIVNGRKWWTSGAMDPRCKISVFMGKSNPEASSYKQQSMILVPMDTPGVQILRPLTVLGYDDAPHGHAEVDFKVSL